MNELPVTIEQLKKHHQETNDFVRLVQGANRQMAEIWHRPGVALRKKQRLIGAVIKRMEADIMRMKEPPQEDQP